MVSEFMGKETEAKNWYTKLTTDYKDQPQAAKAAGALRRLGIEGQPFELQGPSLAGGMFNIAQHKDKIVVVYYWASWNGQCATDFAKLSKIIKEYGAKKVELVSVNLDTTPREALTILQSVQAPGVHLYVPGGLES